MAEFITISSKDSYKIEVSVDNEVLVRISGQITEDIDFTEFLAFVDQFQVKKPVYFDLSQVARINSCGVRAWILFIEKLQPKSQHGFLFLNELMVEQANMISNMLGKEGVAVMGIEMPYFCEKCNQRYPKKVRISDLKKSPGVFAAPAYKCDKCASPLELDVIEEEYLNFLKRCKV